MEHVSESGEVPLQHIFLPDEPPPAKSSEFVKDPSPPVSSIQSPPAPEPVVAERTDLPVQDSSASHKEENGDEDHLVTADTLDPTFSGSESKTAEVGTQVSLPDSTTDDFGESCIQLQFLSDQKLDEIIQRKRMIEAAYRLDCESYTVSVAHMIRQNPDLRERLSSSLRTLLEQRAKRSICELQDYIRQLGR
ncbi:unnamed protein product [Calicophoron daubneyi]|uniref:Periphilin-1 C-terminal domain-containing protein n=1 Tax=Calicophoron daubneyi TaxID=300641 RepID=A0AAV2TB83_CALDB